MSLPRCLVTAALVVAAVFASGCEKKIAAVCEEKCGSSAQICIDSSERAEATAEERGCESAFEEFASCAEAKATCKNGVLDTTACAAEIKELDACQK